MLNVVTHNGVFHTDEVFAVALLEVFTGKTCKVIRTRDMDLIQDHKIKGDFIIDVGGEFNGKTLFDHHQDSSLKSSAGLILDYLGVSNDYPEIADLVEIVDNQDRGIARADSMHIVALVGRFNGSMDNQDKNFAEAVSFVKRILSSMKNDKDSLVEAQLVVEEAQEILPDILLLPEFARQWSAFINATTRSNIKRVVWFDKRQGKYIVQVPPVQPGSFDLNADKLENDSSMEFVHANGFLAVANDYETMISYLR